jgi:hypothetical protein
MSLPSQLYPNPSRIVSGTPIIYNDDVVLYCNTSLAPVVINLLDIPDNYWLTTWKLYIVDYSNNAANNNITINAGTGQTINAQSSVTLSQNKGSVIVQITGNTTYVCNPVESSLADTGWVDLDGFTYYVGVTKPKVRRIGRVVYFKGTVFVPLDNPSSPGSVVPLTTASTYNAVMGCTTFSGSGGCTIDSNGAIIFNNDTSVIPTSVVAGSLDDSYFMPWDTAIRPIDIDATYGTSLTASIRVYITAAKKLSVQLVHDIEITQTRGTGVQGNSPMRFITSNVRLGEYLPNYIGAGTDIHNAPSNANYPLLADAFNLTWPFSCDAGNENQIGGFNFKLDGLTAFIS